MDQKLDYRGHTKPLENVALGETTFNFKNAERITKFDAVLLLSVHHLWYAK